MNNILKRCLRSKKMGMSLIEIMLVMMVVVTLIVGVMTAYKNINNNMKKSATMNTLRLVSNAIQQFFMEVGRYPQNLDELSKRPSNEKESRKWSGPYILDAAKTLMDGWGNVLEYTVDTANNKFDLSSLGANASDETRMYTQEI